MISHGTFHTLALTETGPVYGLDSNIFGQLGIGDLNSNEPVIIEINGIKIKKLCSVTCHSLFLSSDGDIY
jgi:alpha-tubulin suppressor-like RCC1 family protein